VDVAAWLRGLGFGEYASAFLENAVDADVLPDLTDADLLALGVAPLGHRKKILRAIAALRAAPSPSTNAATGPPSAPAPSLHGEAERRHVAVLFADLAGFTALGRELGAEEAHALLERFFARADRIVQEHGGRVDKHIGDCVMAVFGAPVAHGNDAERAARAALAIRDAVPPLAAGIGGRPLEAHIGLAGGQVVASGTGSGPHREYTVTGESVNLAARLTDAAAPGEVLVSDAVRAALAGRMECAWHGALPAKGFDGTVRCWRLLGPAAEADRAAPFVGRRAELGALETALAACRSGGRGQVLHLRGEAGIGKTRLVEEFQRGARACGFACHTGLILDFGAGTGRDAVRALVRGVLGLDVLSDEAAAGRAAADALAAGLAEAEDAVFLNDLLDLPQPAELRAVYDAMDGAARNAGKRRVAAQLVERASHAAPRVLVVEDLHWADPLTLAHVAELAKAAASCPAVLVTTSRPEGDPLDREWRAAAAEVPLVTLDLSPLRAEEARALAGSLAAADTALAERCVERAAGNPLFLEQLLLNAAEEGGGARAGGVPGSVQSLVQARLDRLDPGDKAALQAASVLGQRFARGALDHLVGQAPEWTEAALGRLAAQLLLRRQEQPGGGGASWLFAHALVRDAVYDALLKGRRRELHRRAAAWFADAGRDPALRAEHLDRAEDPGAARAYLEAARSQAAGYRYEAALRLVERGAELATERADRFELARYRGDVLHDLGAMPRARAAYEEALAAAEGEAERCRALIGLAAVKRVTDDLDGALADLAGAEAAAESQGLLAERARIHVLRGNLCFPRGDIPGCLEEHGRGLELARRAGSAELEAAALGGLGDAEYARGRMVSAHARLSECVEVARRHGLGRIEVANAAQVAHTLLYFRPQREALEAALAAAEAAARVGHGRAEIIARNAAYFAALSLCDFGRCREEIAKAQDLVARLGARRFEQVDLLYLGRAALAEGRRDEAVGWLRRALDIAEETGLGFMGPRVLGALARALAPGEERRRALSRAEALIGAGCVAHNQLFFYPAAMEAALETGDHGEVDRYAAALDDYTRPEPLPWADFFVARGRVLAAFGRNRRDPALARELARLRDEGERLGLNVALPAIGAALADAAHLYPFHQLPDDARPLGRGQPVSEGAEGRATDADHSPR
jgi:class 3 adenylate cyclase/tetratricopeptide (TPR) repeat protein